MKKEELSNLYWIKKEIVLQEQRLQELTSEAEGTRAVISNMPKTKIPNDKVANIATEIADLRTAIEANRKRCIKEEAEIEKWLSILVNSETRILLRLRLIEGLHWDAIGDKMGYEKSTVRKKFGRIVDEMLS